MDDYNICGRLSRLFRGVPAGDGVTLDSVVGLPIIDERGVQVGEIIRVDEEADSWYGNINTLAYGHLFPGTPTAMSFCMEMKG